VEPVKHALAHFVFHVQQQHLFVKIVSLVILQSLEFVLYVLQIVNLVIFLEQDNVMMVNVNMAMLSLQEQLFALNALMLAQFVIQTIYIIVFLVKEELLKTLYYIVKLAQLVA
jgi:hypothetical protein